MTFDEILEQVIALLKRQGRVSYGALRMRFNLDDEYLDVLKEELIDAQRVATDEDGRILVWVGDPKGTAAAASQLVQPSSQAPLQQDQPAKIAQPSTESRTPEAERRQLTVMFCDLVDSTKLSSQLDPEDWRNIVREYQRVCSEVIQRYDGHIAQYLGDGLLVYFGYPQAHEDDPHRAVRTGLGILAAMGDLNQALQQEGIQLAVRVGIHTGLVVVGAMGSVDRQEQLALGEVPNIASRIEGLAAPNTIAMSDATYRLVQGYFECQDLGAQALRGVTESIHVYHVLSESGAISRLDVAATRGLTPLVGRESEVTLLLERWQQAKAGHGQVILLTGEGGIGKSRLVQVLKDHVAHEPHVRWECRSSPYYQNTALYPLIDLLQRALPWRQDDTREEKLLKLEQAFSQYCLPLAETIPLFAPLLSLSVPEERYAPLHFSPQRQRQKLLESLVAMLLERAEREPVLLILEDLHWTDPTTLEFLGLLMDHTPTAPLYALVTCRPEFQPSWQHRSYLTEITVTRLAREQIIRIAVQIAGGKTFPDEVLQQIIDKTDGVPLFVEEMTKAILESGHLKEVAGHYELIGSFSTFAIPATLQDSLMARLDRLVTAKGVAQMGATIGRQFAYDLLQVISQLDATTLQRELHRLVEAEIVFQRGLPPRATYTFKHALIQDAAYESLLKSTRQHYHQRIAQVLEAQFPETAETQPELVAHHYTEAGLTEKAVPYWHKAGQRATDPSAHVEAINHLRTGLQLLQTLPETPERLQREVDMLIALGASLRATKGYAAPEIKETYTRARQLCHSLHDPHQLFPVLRGLHGHYNVCAEYQTAQALGEQLLTLAQQAQDTAMLLAAHRSLGTTWFWLGAPAAALTHLAQGIALYDPKQHRTSVFQHVDDPGVLCLSRGAWVLWLLGYPNQALARSHEAVTLAQQLAHPFSLSVALSWVAVVHQFRREVRATQERAEAAISLATEQRLPYWIAVGWLMRGWALAQQAGQAQAGMEQMHQGLSAYRATGAEQARSYWLALLAEAQGTMGQSEAGLTVLAEALVHVEHTGERYYEAEIHRLKGELLLQQNADNQAEAETCFHYAITIAQNQQAKSWELRAATSLARLWHQQGKREEARQVLGDVYHWFTEGFETADLMDANALLDELR